MHKAERLHSMFDVSLAKPAIGATGFFLALVLPAAPFWPALWGWFGSNKDSLQGLYYVAMSIGFLWRGSVWLNRYLWRTHRRTISTHCLYLLRAPFRRSEKNK